MVRTNAWSPDAVEHDSEFDAPKGTHSPVRPSLHPCPGCNHTSARLLFALPTVPVSCCTLWPSRTAAEHCATGRIDLAACRACGLVFNSAFDPTLVEYDTD